MMLDIGFFNFLNVTVGIVDGIIMKFVTIWVYCHLWFEIGLLCGMEGRELCLRTYLY